MTPDTDNVSYSVNKTPIGFRAIDDVSLGGTWFLPNKAGHAPAAVIIVSTGAGIPAKFYHCMATFLAEQGAAVLTFDNRGIGESLNSNIRRIQSGMESWAEFDLGAAIDEAATKFPNTPLNVIAHSASTLFVGATPQAQSLSRLVFLGPHTGYWRDYGRRWRPVLYLTWHVFMPGMTRLFGYFPGRLLKLGENLPPRIAFDWAGRRQPALVRTPEDDKRFTRLLSGFGNMHAETLALSVSDDAFAPPLAAHRLLAMYPGLNVTHRVTSPSSLGRRRVGHFGFLRRPTGEFFWRQAAEWLIPTFPKGTTSQFASCRVCEELQAVKKE